MSATTIEIMLHAYTPLAFRPRVQRSLEIGLVLSAAILWLLVLPLELAFS